MQDAGLQNTNSQGHNAPGLFVRGKDYERNKKWKKDNPEKARLRRKRYAEKHKERISAYLKNRRIKADNDKALHATFLLHGIRYRAKKKNFPFNLDITDIVIPEFCPVLGIKLTRKNGQSCASVDKIKPELGYVKGNIVVVSKLANNIKSNATSEQILKTGEFYKKLGV